MTLSISGVDLPIGPLPTLNAFLDLEWWNGFKGKSRPSTKVEEVAPREEYYPVLCLWVNELLR